MEINKLKEIVFVYNGKDNVLYFSIQTDLTTVEGLKYVNYVYHQLNILKREDIELLYLALYTKNQNILFRDNNILLYSLYELLDVKVLDFFIPSNKFENFERLLTIGIQIEYVETLQADFFLDKDSIKLVINTLSFLEENEIDKECEVLEVIFFDGNPDGSIDYNEEMNEAYENLQQNLKDNYKKQMEIENKNNQI